MSSIKILPEGLANKIAAGEVVERPASIVKELVENSLDAGAARIFVDAQGGGVKSIRVSDDGSGMGPDDALLALERHATSKIRSDLDLASIRTLGFRGEALPSIASVSRMRITTSVGDGGPGTEVTVEGGRLVKTRQAGAARGTIVEVADLFYNTPARLKFLKSRETEFGHIAAAVEKVALTRPEVHFRLTHDGREALDCPPVKDVRDRVSQVYGDDFADRLVRLAREEGAYRVSGFVSVPGASFSDKTHQDAFVNGRPVKSPVVTRALYDAYQSFLMKDRHPASILFIGMPPELVDVNVHPAKREVRFADNAGVHKAVYEAVTGAFKRLDAVDADAGTEAQRGGVREAVETYMAEAGEKRDYMPARGFSYGAPRQETLTLLRAPAARTDRPPEYGAQPLQVLDSYIVLPAEDGFMVIDQHAAHERIQYEKVKARHGRQGEGSQGLLVPVRLDLTAREAALMEGLLPELNAMGIEAEAFGGGSFLIRSKPLFLEKTDIKEVVLGVLSDVEESDVKGSIEGLREKVYQLIACKSAVKAGQRLHPEAIHRLVAQLFECESPYTCAHGRPTAVKFTLNELERMFKRK